MPTERRVERWSVADHEAVRETQALLAKPLSELQAFFKPRDDDDDDDAPRHPPKKTSCACEFCWGAVAVALFSRLLRAMHLLDIGEGTEEEVEAAYDALLRALVRINFCYSREQSLVLDVPEDGVKWLLELTTPDNADHARRAKGIKVKLNELQPLLDRSFRAHRYASGWPLGENREALARSTYDEVFFGAGTSPNYLFVVTCAVMVALAGANWSVGVLVCRALAGVVVAFVAHHIYNTACTPRARGLGYGVSNGSACVIIVITLGGGVPMLMLGAPAATLLLGAPAARLLLAAPLVRLLLAAPLVRLLPGLLLGGPTAGLFLSETLAPLLLPGLLIGGPAAHLFLPEPLARLFRPEPLARLPAPPARLLLAAPPERAALSAAPSSSFLEALKGVASSVAAGLGLVTSAGVGVAPGASCVLCVVIACAVVVAGSTEHCLNGTAGGQACAPVYEASGLLVWARTIYVLAFSAIAGLAVILYRFVGFAVLLRRFCRWARCVLKEGLFRRKVTVDKHDPIARKVYVARNGDPDTYQTLLDKYSVGIDLRVTKDPLVRRRRVLRDMTWYSRAFLLNPKLISIMEDDGVAYDNAKQGLRSAFYGLLIHAQMDKAPCDRNPLFYDILPQHLECTITTATKPFLIETLLELCVARAILGKGGGVVPGRKDLGYFAAISSKDFAELVPRGLQLNGKSLQRWDQHGQPKQPVVLRESLLKYLETPKGQSREDMFFETGSFGVGESDRSVALGKSFATVDSVTLILGWRSDILTALPGLLVDHWRQLDIDIRYLLEEAPELASRGDDAEEAFRQLHLDRLNDYRHNLALERLENNNELPEAEGWESESEDEEVSDDDEDEEDEEDEEDADLSRCERLFIMVIRVVVILLVAAGMCVQYYVLAFPEPLED